MTRPAERVAERPSAPSPARASEGTVAVPVWDVWVRLFHWSLVLSVSFQILSGLTGWQFIDWHRRIGEVVLALVLFRLLWGVFGSSNARLAALVRSPAAAFRHLADLARREVHPEREHNAAGAWAVLAMLALLGVQALTGMFIADEDELIEGAWYGRLDDDLSERLLQLHYLNAQLIEALIVVHVAMIAIYLLWAKLNLVRAMIGGRARWPAASPVPPLRLRSGWIGAALAALAFGAVALAGGWIG